MKTQHRLAVTLKTLMSEMPLNDISVSLLTKKCKVKRQTFYYHFHDIYDLLTQVFLDEVIEGIEDTKNYSELMTVIYKYYEKNMAFLDAVLDSGAKDLFSEFIYNIIYQMSMRYINEIENSSKVNLNSRKAIARFYASAFGSSFVYYLSTSAHKSLNGMLSCFDFVNQKSLSEAINYYL